MIFITRLDGQQMLVNEDLISMAEATPDTVLTFTTGARLMVKDGLSAIDQKIVDFRRRSNGLQLVNDPRLSEPEPQNEDSDHEGAPQGHTHHG